jgi:hypothetical protein
MRGLLAEGEQYLTPVGPEHVVGTAPIGGR